MEFTGKLVGLVKDWASQEWRITFTVNEKEALEYSNELKDVEQLSIVAKKYYKGRSKDSNRLLWECITQIAAAEHLDKWEEYLKLLKRHGTAYPVTIVKEGLAALKATWREIEVVGEWKDEYGVERVTVLCYPGSSLYSTKEFSALLDDVIEDMKALGLQPPASEEMRRALEQWEKSKSHTQH